MKSRLVSRHPARVLGVAMMLALLAVASILFGPQGTPRLRLDPGMTALLPESGAALDAFKRASAAFGDDDVLLVVWRDDDIFSVRHLAAFKRFVTGAADLPGVVRIDSLAAAADIGIEAEASYVGRFLDPLPDTDEAARALRARALSNRLVAGLFVSRSGDALVAALAFDQSLDTHTLGARVAAVNTLSDAMAPDIEQFASGPLALRLDLARLLESDLLRVTPIAMLTTLLVAAFAFRSLHGIVVPIAANGMTTAITLAAMALVGPPLNFVTASVPPVVYVIGFAYAVHVVAAFDRLRGEAGSNRAAIKAVLDDVFLPLTLTAATTVIAFAALAASPITSIRVFGAFVALGTLLAWLGAMSIVPAALCFARPLRSPASAGATTRSWPEHLAGFSSRNRRGILLGGALLALLCGALADRIEVNTAVMSNFAPGHTAQKNFERLESVIGGPVPMRILVEAPGVEGFRDPDVVKALDVFEAWLEQQREIAGSYAVNDYLRALFRTLAPLSADTHGLPHTPRLLAHTLLLAEPGTLHRFVDADMRLGIIRLQTRAVSTAEVNALATRIESYLVNHPPPFRADIAGMTTLTARSVDELTTGQVRSLCLALVAIAILISVLFASIRIGLSAVVPNALPIVAYFGLLGLLPIQLNLTNSLVACAVFGIAIDDTVHFLTRYAQNLERHGREKAVVATLRGVLRPVTLTTFALVAGFAALGAAELRSQAEFGLLAAATLLVAWIVDLVFTPALFGLLQPRLAFQRRP